MTVQLIDCNPKIDGVRKLNSIKYGIAEINGVKVSVFNFTDYYQKHLTPPENKSKRDFNKELIEEIYKSRKVAFDSIIQMYGISNFIFENFDGDMLIDVRFDMVIMAYFNKHMITEAYDYLRDIYADGFAIDEGLIFKKCYSDIPTEFLKQILEERGEL